MLPLVWLLVAIAAGIAAYRVGWPAWRAHRSRDARDLNAERYQAWRGRAVRGQPSPVREGMTGEERRQVYVGAALGLLAAAALLAFFLTS